MRLIIRQEPPTSLADYATISIAFEVSRVGEVTRLANDAARLALTERDVEPYIKDYDVEGDGGPARWAQRFELTQWGLFLARDAGRPVGGAAAIFRAPEITMLRGQDDVALLWDIRVAPGARGRGVGAALLDEVERWSVDRGAHWLEVETQTINVPACRFYERHGFVLRYVNPGAYPGLAHETQLLWYKRLPAPSTARRSSRSA